MTTATTGLRKVVQRVALGALLLLMQAFVLPSFVVAGGYRGPDLFLSSIQFYLQSLYFFEKYQTPYYFLGRNRGCYNGTLQPMLDAFTNLHQQKAEATAYFSPTMDAATCQIFVADYSDFDSASGAAIVNIELPSALKDDLYRLVEVANSSLLRANELVPDELVLNVIRNRPSRSDFPRLTLYEQNPEMMLKVVERVRSFEIQSFHAPYNANDGAIAQILVRYERLWVAPFDLHILPDVSGFMLSNDASLSDRIARWLVVP